VSHLFKKLRFFGKFLARLRAEIEDVFADVRAARKRQKGERNKNQRGSLFVFFLCCSFWLRAQKSAAAQLQLG
jgi:hypothetical protein